MFMAIELFKSFCSWGGDPLKKRLMVPLLKNASIMSFIYRQMLGFKIKVSDQGLYRLQEGHEFFPVICENLICRSKDPTIFFRKIPKSLGGIDLKEDFNYLYCDDFKKKYLYF